MGRKGRRSRKRRRKSKRSPARRRRKQYPFADINRTVLFSAKTFMATSSALSMMRTASTLLP